MKQIRSQIVISIIITLILISSIQFYQKPPIKEADRRWEAGEFNGVDLSYKMHGFLNNRLERKILTIHGMTGNAPGYEMKYSLSPIVGTEGVMEWNQTYSGYNWAEASALIQTADGGFALVCWTGSPPDGMPVVWLIKTDALGTLLWNRTYGGFNLFDPQANFGELHASALLQTPDGGFALAGSISTNPYKVNRDDFWMMKTDAQGTHLWNQTYGGANEERVTALIQTPDGGFALAGTTYDEEADSADMWLVKTDAQGTHLWNQTYGSEKYESAQALLQTADGGYALAGYTSSFGAVGDDMWLVKTDAQGTPQWNETYGGVKGEIAYALIQTLDGGFALAGDTGSYGAGGRDMLLVKTDAQGTVLWSQAYGGEENDDAHALLQMSDGGFVLAGDTFSFGADRDDTWLVRTDANGKILWNQTYGGRYDDGRGNSILVQTLDGGFAFTGHYEPYEAANKYVWLVKVAAETSPPLTTMGNEVKYPPSPIVGTVNVMEWNQTYGGPDEEKAYALIQTADGGFALAGSTVSFGAGYTDFWLVKTDAQGTLLWSQTYGGPKDEWATALIQTPDGGFALAGPTSSFGAGSYDMWLVKTDAQGTLLWSQTYGSSHSERAYALLQTLDGGFALAGYTDSSDMDDMWLVKTDAQGTLLWSKRYGGSRHERAYALLQTADGGFALAGETTTYGAGDHDFWLVKTNAQGNAQWMYSYGGKDRDIAHTLIQTADGSFALAGETLSFGEGGYDMWLVKTDAQGTPLWEQNYGGANSASAASLLQTPNGGFVLASESMKLVFTDAQGTSQLTQTFHGGLADFKQTVDGGYALFGNTGSYGAGGSDFWLVKIIDPLSADSDGDGLSDHAEERIYKTNPANPDTDNDTLTDGDEVTRYETDPTSNDTDQDEIPDNVELNWSLNPINELDALEDFDLDGLSNLLEYLKGTNHANNDTDDDGLTDGQEVNIYDTDPLSSDTDRDTFLDGEEVTLGFDPNDPTDFPLTSDLPGSAPPLPPASLPIESLTITVDKESPIFIPGFSPLEAILALTLVSALILIRRRSQRMK